MKSPALLVLPGAAALAACGTWILDKPAGETLVIRLERRGGRAVVTGVE